MEGFRGQGYTHRLAIAPLPGAIGWVSPVQANPEVSIITATRTPKETNIIHHSKLNLFSKKKINEQIIFSTSNRDAGILLLDTTV